jgi:Protein of unknown function (DUF3037)
MGAYYSIIRYIPDTNSGEFLNTGVLVFSETTVRARFISDWGRLRRFGDGDISFIRQFVKDVERGVEPGAQADRLTPEKILDMAKQWIHCIRLTPPSFAMLDVDKLLEFAATKFLPAPAKAKPKPRTRAAAVKIAIDALKDSFKARGGDEALSYIHRRTVIQGRHLAHEFPVVVRNGTDRLAIEALSFEGEANRAFTRQIKSSAFAVSDIRETSPDIQPAVVMLEPAFELDLFNKTVATFRDKGARVVFEYDVEKWADQTAELVLH